MMDTATLAIVVGGLGLIGSAVTFATFWMQMGSTKTTAESARKSVDDAHKRIDEADKRISATREEYVSKTEMVHLENRIIGEIGKLGTRIDQFLSMRTQG